MNGKWCVCISHWEPFICQEIWVGMRLFLCPKDPAIKDLSKEDCQVAGPFRSENDARRWMLEVEVSNIEAEDEAASLPRSPEQGRR